MRIPAVGADFDLNGEFQKGGKDAMMPNNGMPHLRPTPSLPCGRAVVVDEDAKDLKDFTTRLGRMGYSVQAFTNYQEAERCLKCEHFDFVIVNQGSPAFETHHLVELALARDHRTPVLVVSRCVEINCYLQAMQLGAADYLEKPLAPAEFERLVTTYCQAGQSNTSAGPS
jgi:two-component system response regulator TctD